MRIAAGRVTLGLLGFGFLIALFVLLASIPGESADQAPSVGLAAGNELAVTFALPTGPVVAPPTIDVLWNRPMRVVGNDTRGDEAVLFQITPPVPGRRLWIGSRALRLVPDRPLPRATAFTGRVPAGTKDATGVLLAAPFEWTFSTELPAVTGVSAVAGTRYLDPSGPIAISFDQPVDKTKVAHAIRLTTDAGRTQVPITVTAADSAAIATFELGALPASNLSAIVLVRPDAPLPPASEIDSRCSRPTSRPRARSRWRSPTRPRSAPAGHSRCSGRRPPPPISRSSSRPPVVPDSLLPVLRLEGPALRTSAPPPVTYGGRHATARVNLGVPLLPGKALTIIVGPSSAIGSGKPLDRRIGSRSRCKILCPSSEFCPRTPRSKPEP